MGFHYWEKSPRTITFYSGLPKYLPGTKSPLNFFSLRLIRYLVSCNFKWIRFQNPVFIKLGIFCAYQNKKLKYPVKLRTISDAQLYKIQNSTLSALFPSKTYFKHPFFVIKGNFFKRKKKLKKILIAKAIINKNKWI